MDHEVERDRLQKELADLRARVLTLEATIRELSAERDEYQRAVHWLTQREYAITREDIAEMERDGLTFDQVMEQVNDHA